VPIQEFPLIPSRIWELINKKSFSDEAVQG
jgi:hypothetical protein